MDTIIIAVIITLIIFLMWIFYNKKNNSATNIECKNSISRYSKGIKHPDPYLNISVILDENAKVYKQNPSMFQMKGLEFIDTSTLFDSCGKDLTDSNKLLKQLYGPLIDEKIFMYNKNDDILYNNRWTSINVCKNLNQEDIDIYGLNEARIA